MDGLFELGLEITSLVLLSPEVTLVEVLTVSGDTFSESLDDTVVGVADGAFVVNDRLSALERRLRFLTLELLTLVVSVGLGTSGSEVIVRIRILVGLTVSTEGLLNGRFGGTSLITSLRGRSSALRIFEGDLLFRIL
jgi:hypothetical protein